MSRSAARKPFMVSAPGKVIVFGEHAVVHGKAAIAAATSLRSYLLVTFDDPKRDAVTLDFPDIGLHYSWRISELRLERFHTQPWTGFPVAPKTLDEENLRTLSAILSNVGVDETSESRKAPLQTAAKAFLYMFMSLGLFAFSSCTFTLRSTLPIGAGLGSSASFAVCLAAAMAHQRRTMLDPKTPRDPDGILKFINSWAYLAEVCSHGNPSGVDNSIATVGKAVMFQRTGAPEPTMTPITSFPEIKLLLTDTAQSRSTAREVEKVRLIKNEYPVIVDPILESISQITFAAYELMLAQAENRVDKLPGPRMSFLERLGRLFVMNQGLLVSLGVSHPKLERIRQLTEESGVGWTKLTGAGGGGCAITLLRENPKRLKEVESQLSFEGFKKFEIILGAPGVGYHTQAGKIPRTQFAEAKASEEIERLAGMTLEDHTSHWEYMW